VVAAEAVMTKLLQECVKYMNLIEMTKDLNKFILLNDWSLVGYVTLSKEPELEKAREYVRKLECRQLPKLIHEIKVTQEEFNSKMTSYVPSKHKHAKSPETSLDIEQAQASIIKEKLNMDINQIDKTGAEIYVTHTRPIGSISYQQFEKYGIMLYDKYENKSISMKDAIQSQLYFKNLMSNVETDQNFIIIRVYKDSIA